MEIVYAGQEVPNRITKSVFLAGPTPRSKDVPSWRPEAIKIFKNADFDGTLFVPEPPDQEWHIDYNDQIAWETKCLNIADIVMFWVPRDLNTMIGLTTNVEFGQWLSSTKAVFGAPVDAPKNDYLFEKCKEFHVPSFNELDGMIKYIIQLLGDGACRHDGEVYVPLHVWNTESFKSWYKAQRVAGNRLDKARLLYTFAPKARATFLWILKVDVFITAENRHKTNEFVLARSDISSILVYEEADNLLETKIVLVKEFRSPASTKDGYIWEIPGGSSFKPGEIPLEIVAHELREETELKITPDRFRYVGKRQLAGTLSSHKSHLFAVEISAEEMAEVERKAAENKPMGNIEDTERTYLQVKTLGEILADELLDWSNTGMILSCLLKVE